MLQQFAGPVEGIGEAGAPSFQSALLVNVHDANVRGDVTFALAVHTPPSSSCNDNPSKGRSDSVGGATPWEPTPAYGPRHPRALGVAQHAMHAAVTCHRAIAQPVDQFFTLSSGVDFQKKSLQALPSLAQHQLCRSATRGRLRRRLFSAGVTDVTVTAAAQTLPRTAGPWRVGQKQATHNRRPD